MPRPEDHWLKETSLAQGDRLVISKTMLRSPAFVKLTGSAKQILFELYCRLTLDKLKTSKNKGKGDRFYTKNNGEIVLTYKQCRKMFGFSSDTVSNALDRLVSHGFIEIAELGCGVKRQSHKIALTTNWRQYGTKEFRPGKGKASEPVNKGFKSKVKQKQLGKLV